MSDASIRVQLFSSVSIPPGRYPARRSGFNIVATIPGIHGEVIVGRTTNARKCVIWLAVAADGTATVDGARREKA